LVRVRLPSAQGTSSTTTAWQRRQSTAPHGVQQKNQKSPEGDELETPFGELIVSGGGLMTARTDRAGALARPHGDYNALVIGTEACVLVDKSRKTVAPI
jgi:hypothetical protein